MVRRYQRGVATKLQEYKAGQSCVVCGESDVACLTFHHRVPGEKDFAIGDLRKLGLSWPKLLRELQKCDCLCANCHAKLESKRRGAVVARQAHNLKIVGAIPTAATISTAD